MGIAAADAPRAQGAMTAPSAPAAPSAPSVPGIPVAPGFPAGLLARWGIPADAEVARAETRLQQPDLHRGSPRPPLGAADQPDVSRPRPRRAPAARRVPASGLPFGVPEPCGRCAGDTVAETQAGPATLCRWIPGMRPDLAAEPALERFGQAIGLLSRALRTVPWSDAPQDWRGDPLRAHPDAPETADLARALRDAGLPAARVRRLEAAARRVLLRAPEAGEDLPVQVVHGDLGASNVLVDERTGELTGVLDFELAGPDARVQDLLVGCCSPARWPGPAGAAAPPPWSAGTPRCCSWTRPRSGRCRTCSCCRCVGSVFWRAGRWRRGQAALSDVANRVAVLEAVEAWLAVHRGRLLTVLAAAGG